MKRLCSVKVERQIKWWIFLSFFGSLISCQILIDFLFHQRRNVLQQKMIYNHCDTATGQLLEVGELRTGQMCLDRCRQPHREENPNREANTSDGPHLQALRSFLHQSQPVVQHQAAALQHRVRVHCRGGSPPGPYQRGAR